MKEKYLETGTVPITKSLRSSDVDEVSRGRYRTREEPLFRTSIHVRESFEEEEEEEEEVVKEEGSRQSEKRRKTVGEVASYVIAPLRHEITNVTGRIVSLGQRSHRLRSKVVTLL
ncbi:hypothetical protein KPH14_006711 [Odynerus spinipes]|uniref:Uncharacterized protein n=1 Tax=Odynerus spinipes TaxID=1348599 RepID=A0AAD9RRJ9_9HYME|nr:hypothetical protein KPH14_006711 [Odynerus spinipes]